MPAKTRISFTFVLFIFFIIVVSGCTKYPSNSMSCGDGKCNNGETCSTCPQDCLVSPGKICCSDKTYAGNCCSSLDCTSPLACINHNCQAKTPICGNKQCESGENCSTCSQDCGPCPQKNECTLPKAECANGDCRILIAVESQTYQQLQPEIERYRNDIKDDMGIDTVLNQYSPSSSRSEIKDDIKSLNNQHDLVGVVLIGDIPTAYYDNDYNPFGKYPSDFYYQDVYDSCSYDPNLDVYNSSTCLTEYRIADFWIGRIKPPVNGSEGINLLQEYFDRNHRFRKGGMGYNKELLVYAPMQGQQDEQQRTAETERFFEGISTYSNMYSKSQIKMIPLTDDSDSQYLTELQRPYEIAYYNGHGDAVFHQKGIDYTKIIETKPNALYYKMASCSVGRYTEENYIAGWYLFGGNGLFAIAPTTPAFFSFGIEVDPLFIFSQGGTFGQAYSIQNGYSMIPLMGDPTLRMRYSKERSNAKICLNITEIKIDSSKSEQRYITFDVFNKGNETLKVRDMVGALDLELPHEASNSFTMDVFSDEIPSMSNKTFSVYFAPNEKGDYRGYIFIISNDPDNYIVRIPFEATAK